MKKFKVGDSVEIVERAACCNKVGDVGTVVSVTDTVCNVVVGSMQSQCYKFNRLKLAWQPQNGDVVQGRDDDNDSWNDGRFVFIGMDEKAYIVRDEEDDCYLSWEQVRIKTTVTIINESTGEKVEISQESSAAIFGQ